MFCMTWFTICPCNKMKKGQNFVTCKKMDCFAEGHEGGQSQVLRKAYRMLWISKAYGTGNFNQSYPIVGYSAIGD